MKADYKSRLKLVLGPDSQNVLCRSVPTLKAKVLPILWYVVRASLRMQEFAGDLSGTNIKYRI